MKTVASQAPAQPKIYSMLNDFAFQWIFGRRGNEKLTISLLNAILHLEKDNRICVLEFLNPFNMRQFKDQKLTIVDVKAQDEKGRWYNIEAQVHEHDGFVFRTALYVALLYSRQALAGDDYTRLSPATGISILGFNLFRQSEKIQEFFEFRNRDGSISLPDTMALHYIDLTKFPRKRPDRLLTPFEKWLHVMKFSTVYGKIGTEIPELLAEEEAIVMAINQHQQLNASDKMRRRMECREKEAFDIAHIKGSAYDRGKAEGMAKGKAQTALNMHARGIDKQIILDCTGLTEAELEKLITNKKSCSICKDL